MAKIGFGELDLFDFVTGFIKGKKPEEKKEIPPLAGEKDDEAEKKEEERPITLKL